MDQQSNTLATVALVAGLAVWLLQVLLWCVGFIPVINMVTLVIAPIAWLLFIVLDITAVVAGFMGRSQAAATGVGSGSATAGIVLGVMHVLFYIALIAFVFLLGGGMVLLSLIGAAAGN